MILWTRFNTKLKSWTGADFAFEPTGCPVVWRDSTKQKARRSGNAV